jgi:predicted ATPase
MLQPASRQLFGRESELAVLTRALADSERGRARLVWIGGEPGIGKTRLAEELAAAAATQRATVAWARCVDADAAPPYWPWAEGIRALLRTVTLEELQLPLSCLKRLSALVPDLVHHPAMTARPAAIKTASDRYQLFDAVRTLLQRASSRALLVLIFDDLHQADASSLLLLEFVARELADSRLLLVVTYRADEISTRLGETMGELARVGLQKVVLTGLGLKETGQLLTYVSGTSCSDDLVRQVHAPDQRQSILCHRGCAASTIGSRRDTGQRSRRPATTLEPLVGSDHTAARRGFRNRP